MNLKLFLSQRTQLASPILRIRQIMFSRGSVSPARVSFCKVSNCQVSNCQASKNDTPGRFLAISPARVRLVVYVPGGALPVALRAPAAAVDGVPHLESPPVVLGEAGGDGGPVGALAAADVGAEVLHKEQEQAYFFSRTVR